MRVVVTGAAGFIGGHVAEALGRSGHEVLAVDCLARSASPQVARRSWDGLGGEPGITLAEADLARDDLSALTRADVVVHLAGRPGVRSSWGAGRMLAERDNVTATARLLAACAGRPAGRRPRVVVASSSSVYGPAERTRPTREDDPIAPASPYAESKAEVERLAARAARDGLPTVVLRYFSVYGPRQRPDMAFHRFIEAALDGRPLPVFGDGRRRSRSFTHVDDVVAATGAVTGADLPSGIPINIGHPEPIAVLDAIELMADVLDVRPLIGSERPVAGDSPHTWADSGRAPRLLGWKARVGPAEGIAGQVAWHRAARVGVVAS